MLPDKLRILQGMPIFGGASEATLNSILDKAKSILITHEAQLLSLWCKHNGTY
ncbi:MAG: hypothetical protein ABW161_14845 [Candidatus Thiodiazotropha sp.]